MNHENLIEQANELDIKELAERYTQLHKAGKEYHGPCPVCRGGTDRFFIVASKNRAGCRQCAKGWDTVALYAAITGSNMGDSARELLGVTKVSREQAPKLKPATKVHEAPVVPEEWQKEAHSLIKNSKALVSSESPAKYLASRGISARTYERFHLGFTTDAWDPQIKARRSAIVIPWADRTKIYAVKFRFIDDKGDLRYGSKKHSDPVCFGAHIPKDSKTLVITEGEFNAMAIYESGADCNVVSIGGQSNARAYKYVHELAQDYRYVVGWFDELGPYNSCKAAVSTHMTGVISSRLGLDANDFLTTMGAEAMKAVIHRAIISPPGTCPLCCGQGFFLQQGSHHLCECKLARKSA